MNHLSNFAPAHGEKFSFCTKYVISCQNLLVWIPDISTLLSQGLTVAVERGGEGHCCIWSMSSWCKSADPACPAHGSLWPLNSDLTWKELPLPKKCLWKNYHTMCFSDVSQDLWLSVTACYDCAWSRGRCVGLIWTSVIWDRHLCGDVSNVVLGSWATSSFTQEMCDSLPLLELWLQHSRDILLNSSSPYNAYRYEWWHTWSCYLWLYAWGTFPVRPERWALIPICLVSCQWALS